HRTWASPPTSSTRPPTWPRSPCLSDLLDHPAVSLPSASPPMAPACLAALRRALVVLHQGISTLVLIIRQPLSCNSLPPLIRLYFWRNRLLTSRPLQP